MNLTSHGTADGSTGIGFSSANNAAVLTDDGTLIANTATSPALAKLRDYLRDWESADRLAITDLAVMTETKNEGLAVRLVPASR